MNENQGFWNKWNGSQFLTQSGVEKTIANNPKDQIIQVFQASSTSWVTSPSGSTRVIHFHHPQPCHREFVAIWMILLEKKSCTHSTYLKSWKWENYQLLDQPDTEFGPFKVNNDRVWLSRRFHGCWLLTLATLANPWLTASSAREVHRSHAFRHSMTGCTAGVKMKLKLEVVSCANTSWCTKMHPNVSNRQWISSYFFLLCASFGVLSVNIQSSKLYGPFACAPVGNSNVQAVEIRLDPRVGCSSFEHNMSWNLDPHRSRI